MNFKPFANPILIVSDNPAGPGGLARMCRDLATLCCTIPQFRVAVLGRGIGNRRKFPFINYDFPEYQQWGESYLMGVWEDLAGDDNGVIITLDDASRRHWFANPIGLSEDMQKFLGPGRNFQKWMYLPLDGTGPNESTLPLAGRDCVSRYDRVLAASEWGRDVLVRGGRVDADWLPHGIDTNIFHPIDCAKGMLGDDWRGKINVGCVMANQSRKDYPVAFDCLARLRVKYGNKFHAWIHTDELIRYWNLPSLAAEYNLGDCLEVTTGLNDHQLAERYSACDCTILPSGGEGFGYPVAESLSCGTACIVSTYSGSAELVSPECRVRPDTYRVDTAHNMMRAVLCGAEFAAAAWVQTEIKRNDYTHQAERLAQSVEHLGWNNLKHPWTRWLLEGLK